MDVFLKVVGAVVVVAVLVVAAAAIYAFPVKWLWNWLLPSIFNLRKINVFEAWGMLALCGLLFRSSSSARKSD